MHEQRLIHLFNSDAIVFASMKGQVMLKSEHPQLIKLDSLFTPVVFHKCGFCAVHQSKRVFGGLIPLNCINTVGAVIVACYHNAAQKLFGTFILKVLFALLIQHIPATTMAFSAVN